MKQVSVLLITVLTLGLSATLPGEGQTNGKAVFTEKKCNDCHSVDSEGIATLKKWPTIMWTRSCNECTPDLSTVGDRRKNPKWLKAYLKGKKNGRNGFKHNYMCLEPTDKFVFSFSADVFPLFADKKDEDSLNSLVAWLMTLKKQKE